jgi:ABC-type multidrug transport system ATPase subunit
MHAFEARGLRKKYPGRTQPANHDVGFDVVAGETFCLLGENGSGKSTLVRQLAGLTRPDAGTVTLFGRDVFADHAETAMQIGYQPQSGFALGHLTVAEALFSTGRLRGLRRAAAKASRDELISRCDLEGNAGTLAQRLSGGQLRMTQLALAMAGRPPVLILDEPTNDLDPHHRRLVWQLCVESKLDHGTTIVVVTHDAGEVERAVDRVAILSAGRLAALGRPTDLRARLDAGLRLTVPRTGGPPIAAAGLPAWHESEPGHWTIWLRPEHASGVLDRLDPRDLANVRLEPLGLEDMFLRYAARPAEEEKEVEAA